MYDHATSTFSETWEMVSFKCFLVNMPHWNQDFLYKAFFSYVTSSKIKTTKERKLKLKTTSSN